MTSRRRISTSRPRGLVAATAAAALLLSGCVAARTRPAAGGDAPPAPPRAARSTSTSRPTTRSPSIIKDQGWLEDALGDQDVTSTGCSRPAPTRPTRPCAPARSTSGRPPGPPRCWPARTDRRSRRSTSTRSPSGRRSSSAGGSTITDVADLKGKKIAATKGTDPYFFLLQALEEAGLGLDDVTIAEPPARRRQDGAGERRGRRVGRSRPDHGRRRGRPGAKLIYRNIDFNSYGFLNATEDFIAERPTWRRPSSTPTRRLARGRMANPEETAQILADVAGIDLAVATKVITERIEPRRRPGARARRRRRARDHRPDLRRVRRRVVAGQGRRGARRPLRPELRRRRGPVRDRLSPTPIRRRTGTAGPSTGAPATDASRPVSATHRSRGCPAPVRAAARPSLGPAGSSSSSGLSCPSSCSAAWQLVTAFGLVPASSSRHPPRSGRPASISLSAACCGRRRRSRCSACSSAS